MAMATAMKLKKRVAFILIDVWGSWLVRECEVIVKIVDVVCCNDGGEKADVGREDRV